MSAAIVMAQTAFAITTLDFENPGSVGLVAMSYGQDTPYPLVRSLPTSF
jgi:hypothetical protein